MPGMQIAEVIQVVIMAMAKATGWALTPWPWGRGEMPTNFAAACTRPTRLCTTL